MSQEEYRILGVIPARRGSTRLPDKILKNIAGKPLIQRVWEQASKCRNILRLIVSTDDEGIKSAAESFGAEVLMTSPSLPSGSARVVNTYRTLEENWDIVINIQGDMPFIHPDAIDQAIVFMTNRKADFDMVTIAIPIQDEDEFLRPSSVKVVTNNEGRALYFSRAPIPHSRDGELWKFPSTIGFGYGLKHIGLYLFNNVAMEAIEANYVSNLESVECLEQLKLLELGLKVGVCIIDPELMKYSVEIDTNEDVIRAESLLEKGVFSSLDIRENVLKNPGGNKGNQLVGGADEN